MQSLRTFAIAAAGAALIGALAVPAEASGIAAGARSGVSTEVLREHRHVELVQSRRRARNVAIGALAAGATIAIISGAANAARAEREYREPQRVYREPPVRRTSSRISCNEAARIVQRNGYRIMSRDCGPPVYYFSALRGEAVGIEFDSRTGRYRTTFGGD